MASLADVLDALETIAPSHFAFSWDKIGLQVGDREQEVRRAVLSLDRSMAAIDFAAANHAQLLLTHHPVIFDPIPSVTSDTYEGRSILNLIQSGISHICAHTNWDVAPGGINDTLADLLGLLNVTSFGSAAGETSFKLVVFVPSDSVKMVIDACSIAGAGVIGQYNRCAFFATGQGTYEPGPDSSPHNGQPGTRSNVDEVRVEMVCPSHAVKSVSAAIRQAHPYEEPALDLYSLMQGKGQEAGRIGQLTQPLSLSEFADVVDGTLSTRSLTWGDRSQLIRTVAVVGGAADGEWQQAKAAGADILVTGEVKQHLALEVSESGFAIMAAGHYATEQPGTVALKYRMGKLLADVEWLVFEPQPGASGRPL
ncbi:MAG: Nif3-like dinuclear metal center hexameric protein [Chlorobia bacterium]|nr:Nif3-like dinuclear metal center hexameric protein [Fimbriimonadaceae bacterium]